MFNTEAVNYHALTDVAFVQNSSCACPLTSSLLSRRQRIHIHPQAYACGILGGNNEAPPPGGGGIFNCFPPWREAFNLSATRRGGSDKFCSGKSADPQRQALARREQYPPPTPPKNMLDPPRFVAEQNMAPACPACRQARRRGRNYPPSLLFPVRE